MSVALWLASVVLKVMVLVDCVRLGRIGLPIAHWVPDTVLPDGRFAVDFADLAEIGLPLMDETNHPRVHQYTQQHTLDWSARVRLAP